MRIAYLIVAHRQPDQLERLLRAIHDPDNLYLLQLDSKAPRELHARMSTFAARQSNLALAPARDIRWASWSLMDARLEGIERLLAMGRPWDLLINLSGQCFPLRTQPQIRAALDDQPGRNFVETFDPLTTWVDPYARVRRIRIEVPFRSTGYNLPRLRVDRWQRHLGDARFVGGSPYAGLTREFCEHLIRSPLLPRYRRCLRFAYRPDEVLLPTFIMNSPMKDSVVNRNFHRVDWRAGGSHPRTCTIDDAAELLASEAFFARKFDIDVDAPIVDLLESRLVESRPR